MPFNEVFVPIWVELLWLIGSVDEEYLLLALHATVASNTLLHLYMILSFTNIAKSYNIIKTSDVFIFLLECSWFIAISHSVFPVVLIK